MVSSGCDEAVDSVASKGVAGRWIGIEARGIGSRVGVVGGFVAGFFGFVYGYLVVVDYGTGHEVEEEEGGYAEPGDVVDGDDGGAYVYEAHVGGGHEVVAQVGPVLARQRSEEGEHGFGDVAERVRRIGGGVGRHFHKLLIFC